MVIKNVLNAPKWVKTNREYKSSVFSSVFSEYPEELLKIIPVRTSSETVIENVTLDNVLFMEQVNDLALLADSALLLFFEHQSTINHNMCIRMLIYYARVMEQLLTGQAKYWTKQVPLPYPIFIVLYNGNKNMKDVTMHLSDAFMDVNTFLDKKLMDRWGGDVPVDLTLKMVNINKGNNSDLVEKSEILGGYVELVDRVKRYVGEGMNLPDAATKAVRECIDEGILKDYLTKHASEVENMLFGEWDINTALMVREEEVREEVTAEVTDKVTAEYEQIVHEREERIAVLDAQLAALLSQ
jgi:hypothetical protein